MLTVLQVSYPLAPVGKDAVGGAEQVLTQLDEALVKAGMRSVVVACEGSRTTGELVPTPRIEGPLDEEAVGLARRNTRNAVLHALTEYPVDVVHLHGVDFHSYLPPEGVPALATLHLPPSWYPEQVFNLPRPDTHLACVSGSQRRACPPDAEVLEVHNGIAVQGFPLRRQKEGFVLSLGRICPEKGFHLALQAAQRAGVRLKLAGQTFPYPTHVDYFRNQVEPLLDDQREFIGPATFDQKRWLLGAARCLLIPSLVPETSSLVAMEALACGTPVIAFDIGALPEIVEHGRTGFIVKSWEEMADAITRVDTLWPEELRRTAETRFSAEAMAQRYLSVYERVRRRAPLAVKSRVRSAASGRDPALDVEEVHSPSELESRRRDWSRLCNRCPTTTPFQRPEWLLPWWRRFGGDRGRAALVWRHGELVAMGAFTVGRWEGQRLLQLMGTGISDYLDVLVDPSVAMDGTVALLEAVSGWSAEWDVCELQQLKPGSPLLTVGTPPGWSSEVEPHDASPVLVLPECKDGLPTSVPRRLASNLRQSWRRAVKAGGEWVEPGWAGQVDPLMEALFRLHASRWAEKGQSGVLSDEGTQAFHLDVARGFHARRALILHGLRIGGRLAAVTYGFLERRRAYYYLGGFSPEFSRLSPGSLAISRAIERAVQNGALEFDFLRGQEGYKYAWGARDQVAHRRVFRRRDSTTVWH